MDADKHSVLARIAAELMYLYGDTKAIGDPVLAGFIEAAMRMAEDRADQAGAAGEMEKPGG